MKTFIATVGAAMAALTLCADVDEASLQAEQENEEESSLFSAGVDIDLFSAYIWRNAVQNDRMVIQPCVWADFEMPEPLYFGFYVFQNYDLTDRNRDVFKHGLTETDFDVHVGVGFSNNDESMTLKFELGHQWDLMQGVRSEEKSDMPSTREVYFKTIFENEIVNVYGQASWMYKDFGDFKQSMYYECGLNKEFEVIEDKLTLGADWNVNFGDPRYLTYIYGGMSEWDDEEGDYVDNGNGSHNMIGGTTFKVYASWNVVEHIALKGTLAYTGILNRDIRDAHGDFGDENRDILWGGISLNVEF